MKTLEVILTQTHDLKPLAVIKNLPGLDAEMTPSQMRRLAFALQSAANDCESLKTGKLFKKNMLVEYAKNMLVEYALE